VKSLRGGIAEQREMSVDVIVVGAGLSGLVTAYRLQRAGLRVQVFEAAARPGGVIGSERKNGVLFERGPNSGLDTTPAINTLLDDLGIRDQRIDASKASSRRYVVRGGHMVALPTSPGAFIATPLFSWAAKLRLFAEPFIARATADVEESIAQFVRRRLGREFLDYAIEPFVSGIYAGDPDRLSLQAAFPRLHALEQRYGSLMRGAILGARERRRSAEKPKSSAGSFSFREGFQTLTDALAAALPSVTCGTRATGLRREADGTFSVSFEGATPGERRARAVVLAVPAYAGASLVAPLAPEAARALSEIPYSPVAVVISAYRRRAVGHPLDGFGVLVPAVERPGMLGSLFSSTMFENRAATDTAVFTTFLGGRRDPALAAAPDAELLQTVQRELSRLVGVSEPPIFNEITRWPRAIPQYTLGHLQRIATLEQAERDVPGLNFCANYRGGVSISDCVIHGEAMARQVAGWLGTATPAVAVSAVNVVA
jgi:protoporphyrinogen/coproporphyrinogen III oxidase